MGKLYVINLPRTLSDDLLVNAGLDSYGNSRDIINTYSGLNKKSSTWADNLYNALRNLLFRELSEKDAKILYKIFKDKINKYVFEVPALDRRKSVTLDEAKIFRKMELGMDIANATGLKHENGYHVAKGLMRKFWED